MLCDLQKIFFEKNGYLILKNVAQIYPFVSAIKAEVQSLCKRVVDSYTDESSVEKIAALPKLHRHALYNGLRYLPATTKLACSPLLLKLSKLLNIMQPAVMHSYNLRMDMPHEKQFLFQWHQDITYLLGSRNSLTYWIPLTVVNEHHGSIELIRGSHAQGLVPFHYTGQGLPQSSKSLSPLDIRLNVEPTQSTDLIQAEPGDIVVFSQFLLHRSTPNNSNRIRWVAQIRHSDFSDADFLSAGFPFGDRTNIFHHDYLN